MQRLYLPTCVLTPSFQRLPSGPAGNAHFFFSLPEYFKNLLAIFVHRLLCHLLNGGANLLKHLHSFLQFSDAFTSLQLSRYFSIPLARFSKAILRLLHHVPLISFFSGRPTSFAEAGESAGCCWDTAGLLPQVLDSQGHTTRSAHSHAARRLLPDFPTIVFCLPRNGSASLMCRKVGEDCCLFQLRASRRTSRRPQGFLASAIFPPHQCPP